MPLKSIERQLVAVLKNPNQAEMENQIYPLLNTATKGDGTVLLQNHLGNFGLEKLLQPASTPPPAATSTKASEITPALPMIPGEGSIVTARQLVEVFSGLAFNELSCARIIPEQTGKPIGNVGILLFTTKEGSPRSKGGAMEFEFSAGKINRIAFQSPSYRDFEQDVIDHPELGGCRIDPAYLAKLH